MRRFSKITTTQLARICGVSQGTVDRALHNRQGINPETRKQILAVAREYDYVPNTRNSGPENSMLFYSLYLWHNAFGYFKMGYASAMAWILFIIILILLCGDDDCCERDHGCGCGC